MMDTTMKKSLTVVLLAGGLVLAALLVLGVVLALDWPLWVGFFLLLLVAGSAVGAFLLRRLWLRRREQVFTDQVIEQEISRIEAAPQREHADLKALQEQWKNAIETLRGSHLKKHGNPLYVLPWYLVIGESGSGKTTSLTSAGLSSPLGEKNRTLSLSGTRNCEWWFFEQAIVIDTAGRYAVPVDEEADKEEWRGFLRLLAKYRKREPLNGVIVTVAADRLLSADREPVAEEGRVMRRRVDELMRVLGTRFPVYLMVTKCDLIEGMQEFARRLPQKSLDQPMGVLNQTLAGDVAAFVESAVATVLERLRSLRLYLLLQPQAAQEGPGLLLFPEEFSHLKEGLAAFTEGAFASNRYQETPILRGIFFSSGHQGGSPYSRFAETLGLPRKQEPQPEAHRGLFLHDFFAKILPKDRAIFAPTRRALEWQRITANLGLVAWIIVGVALCGLLSFSFVKNLSTIRQISHRFPQPPQMRGEPLADLAALDRYREGIGAVEQQNRNWWMPRFGLTESLRVEEELKRRFCRQFHSCVLLPLDRRISQTVGPLSGSLPDEVYGQYVVHLTRRINLLRARQRGDAFQSLKAMPQPAYLSFDAGREAKETFAADYLTYLDWCGDSADLGRDVAALQGCLKQLLAHGGGELQWLVAWVDHQGVAVPVTLAEFWGGSVPVAGERGVPPAFTRKGQQEVASVLREIEAALPELRVGEGARGRFEQWYAAQTFAAWESFVAFFPRGMERLKGEREWQDAAAKMARDGGPYFALLNRMALELGPLQGQGNLPSYVQQLNLFQLAAAEGVASESRAVSKATTGGKKLLVSLEKRIGKAADARSLESRLTAGRLLREYRAALAAIAPATASRNQAYLAAAQVFGEDPAVGKSPFLAAFSAAQQLKSELAGQGGGSEPFARILSGPLDFLWSFVRKEAAGHLQSQWEEQVVAPTLGVPPQQAMPLLLGPDGLAWRFVKGPAAPFLTRSLRGYRGKELLGGNIPFEGPFLGFLERGTEVQAAALSKQSNYSVGIQGLPTDANADARVKPQATLLELQCGATVQSLANHNYPLRKTFNWSPDSCGEVNFQIEIGDLVLTKRYGGAQGFPEFLQSFSGGQRTFYPRDFPGEQGALGKMGIKYIRVNYQITGGAQVIKQGSSVSGGQVPRSITRCWTF